MIGIAFIAGVISAAASASIVTLAFKYLGFAGGLSIGATIIAVCVFLLYHEIE